LSVNGEEKHIRPSEPLIITEEEYKESSPKVIKIEKFDSYRMEIKFFELGAKIFADSESKTLKIKLAPWSTLQGELCGICGNYNLDQSDDFTPSESLGMTPVTGRKSYFEENLLPSDTCDVERIYNTDDESSVTEKHLTLRRYDNEVPMICRSEKKIIQCSPGYRPIRVESVKTCFTCQPEPGFTVRRQAYYTPSWEEERSGEECTDFHQRIEVPTRCVPVY
jgi:hypothetical protein